jgi:diacylglycerol kinase family enzyme
MTETTEIILNPAGNRNRDGRAWMACQRICLRRLAPAEVTVVASVAEAAQAARQSALKGYQKIISVGDGATAHGVVNGVMGLAEGHLPKLKVGFLSLSRPDQWSRTLGLPRNLERQLEILAGGHTLPFDVGRVECQNLTGERIVRHFLNGATFGVTGSVKHEWGDPRTNLFESMTRSLGALREAVSAEGSQVRLESGEEVLHEGPCVLAMVMGGHYYPSFGKIAPQADPTDGLLDLAWIGPGSTLALLAKLAGLWLTPLRRGRGALAWRSVEQMRAAALSGPVYLELDGQPTGRLPATFSALRRTLPVIVAPVAVKLHKPNFVPVEKMRNGRLAGNIKSAAGL